jgi:hypothetical protein
VITLTEIATDAEPQTIAAGFLITYAVLRRPWDRLREFHRRHLQRRADRRLFVLPSDLNGRGRRDPR